MKAATAIGHGKDPRGLTAAGIIKAGRPVSALGFGSRFGRFFPSLPGAEFSDADLQKLADEMVAPFDPPKDGLDSEESGIPAIFTYFGQFVDHDLTFDPEGSFQKEKDPTATIDFRTPAFDLDNVYGRGPGDQPYMYNKDGTFFLGDQITNGEPNGDMARDLPRGPGERALIGDPRNDENAIVSQLQGLLLRFHNRVVKDNANVPKIDFMGFQKIVRWHYQYVVVNDFLSRIVSPTVLDTLKKNGIYDESKLKLWKKDDLKNPFMPVEFSVAAYRLGHSMVRPGYRLNDAVIEAIFPVKRDSGMNFPEGLTGFRKLISNWAIDWDRFINLNKRDYGKDPDLVAKMDPGIKREAEIRKIYRRLQFAYCIDTSLVNPLGMLPPSVASDPSSLALRNLKRGVDFGLPSGQMVAEFLEVPTLKNDEIKIGKFGDNDQKSISEIAGGAFKNRCPLWTYVLAEAMHHAEDVEIPVKGEKKKIKTPKLGPVGGRIVAEVFIGLLFADSRSYLNINPKWQPNNGNDFGLREFIAYALGEEGISVI